MVQLYAFRRSLHVVALALCSTAFVVSATPASARSHHHFAGRYAHGRNARRHYASRHYRQIARASRAERGIAQVQARGFASANASLPPSAGAMAASGGSDSSNNVVAEARHYIGGNPTSRATLWCARFMNMVLQHLGYRGTGSDAASSFASYGQRVPGPQVGAIAVMARRGGGHVGIVSGVDAHGNPILVSGNNRNRVVEAPVSRGRIYAYVLPTS